MGRKNPERDPPTVTPKTLVRKIAENYRHWALEARCKHCIYWAHLYPRYIVAKYGDRITIAELERRLRCTQCRMRGAEVRARFGGHFR